MWVTHSLHQCHQRWHLARTTSNRRWKHSSIFVIISNHNQGEMCRRYASPIKHTSSIYSGKQRGRGSTQQDKACALWDEGVVSYWGTVGGQEFMVSTLAVSVWFTASAARRISPSAAAHAAAARVRTHVSGSWNKCTSSDQALEQVCKIGPGTVSAVPETSTCIIYIPPAYASALPSPAAAAAPLQTSGAHPPGTPPGAVPGGGMQS